MTRDAVTSDQLPPSGLPFSVASTWSQLVRPACGSSQAAANQRTAPV